MHVAYTSIMHCSLPVISLLTCCQKEVLKACTCLYIQAARYSGILSPPSRHEHYLTNVPGLEHFMANDSSPWVWALFGLPARGMQSIFKLPSCYLYINIAPCLNKRSPVKCMSFCSFSISEEEFVDKWIETVFHDYMKRRKMMVYIRVSVHYGQK